MPGRAIHFLLVAAFGVAVGHLGWFALLGPPPVPEYLVGGRVPALIAPGSDAKQLYLRHQFFLTQRPTRAWIRCLARDHLRLYVNDNLIQESYLDGYPLAIQADLAPYFQVGLNVIAILANRTSLGEAPAVAIEGAYELTDGEHPFCADETWRCFTCFEHKAGWWFQTMFDERHWPYAQLTTGDLVGKVRTPPRALSAPRVGRWITPAAMDQGVVTVRKEFDVDERPRQSWLRLTATSNYRLAVNGVLIDQREDQIATTTPTAPVQRTYDLTTLVGRGRNVLSLVLTAGQQAPHVRADVEVEGSGGRRVTLGTDADWLQCPGLARDWLRSSVVNPAEWHTSHVEAGQLDVMPWEPRRETVEVVLPLPAWARLLAGQIAVMLAAALLAMIACRLAARMLASRRSAADKTSATRCIYLALLPATLAIAAAVLATYDPRIARQDVYHGRWVLLAVLSAPLQWLLLVLASRSSACPAGTMGLRPELSRPEPAFDAERGPQPSIVRALLVLALIVGGFWMRFKDIDAEPLHPDEWWNYTATKGFLRDWYPSVQNHKDLPTSYASTYEIMPLCGPALVAMVCDCDYYIVRLPSICWACGTIVLLYFMGRRLFSPAAGLVAAALFAFSPIAIQMANFGRYYSQLTFMASLCLHFFWLTIRKTGAPLDRKALWLCVLSFFAVYLTWEPGALMAVGMMLATIVHRRGSLRTVLLEPSIWIGMLVLLMGIGLQYENRDFQQIQRMWYGSGGSDVTLAPMWGYPTFLPWFYLWESTWNPDALLPMLGVVSAGLLAVRHTFRRPLLFLLIVYLTTAAILGLLFPLTLWRYAYWLSPLAILLASGALVGGVRELTKLPRAVGGARVWRFYAQGLGAAVLVVGVTLGCGCVVQLSEMGAFRTSGYRLGQLKFPHLASASAFLREHFREGDVVITTLPHVTDHYWGRKSDYWLQTLLSLQASIDDKRVLPLHKICGTEMIPDIVTLDWICARAPRVWYIPVPAFHEEVNDPTADAYVLQYMDVVFEDFQAAVLLMDRNHRPQVMRLLNQKALGQVSMKILQ